MSRGAARASAAAEGRVTEDVLLTGYGPCPGCGAYPCSCVAIRQEPCACGLVIRAPYSVPPTSAVIQRVVEEHNDSKPHRAWRHWRAELEKAA